MQQHPLRTLRKTLVRAVVGTLALALLTFAAFKLRMDLASAIPLYMLLVVAQSMTGDFWSAAVVSILSAACLDFFFTQPLFRFYVSNPLNLLALIAFIFTALVITRLVSRARAEAKSSKLQKDQLDRLYALSRQLLVLEPEGMMTEKFLEPYRRLFGVTAICAFDAQTAEVHLIGASRELAQKTRQAYIAGNDLKDAKSHLSVRCLRVSGGGKMTGAIGFEGLQDSEEVTGSLAALTAALVERTKAFRNASAAAAATQAETYRSAVLDALAHEFKTPLATILAAAGGIREVGPLGPEQQDMAETVESEAVRLSSLTSRLLRTARLDREEIKPRMEMIDLVPLVSRIVSQYSERSPDRDILQTISPEPLEVYADPQLLRIALSQLVENACKYSVPGSTVTVALDRQGDSIAVRVSNTGSAIPYKERGKIFDRFYRGDAGRSTSGSGLGLFVARKIAIAHQGALDLEEQSRPGGTVTFCLTVPFKKKRLTVSLQPNSVLIVDDEASLRKTLNASLTASGFAVEEARSGEEAVTAVHKHPFDLVLLDINMPGIGGLEACRRIRSASPHAGIVMITVRDFDDDKIRGLEAGADDYITKPFKLRELLARVRAVLRRTSLQAASEPAVVEIGQLKIDFERRLFWRKGEEIHLSPKEFELLAFMIKHAGFPLTHVKLLRSIWGLEYGGELEYLRSYVRMLRKKIEDDPDNPKYILTEPWVGYRFSDCSGFEAKTTPASSKPRSSSA